MRTKKINLSNFAQNVLIARLYVLQKNFNLDNFETNDDLTVYCKKLVSVNFILPTKDVKNCATDLALFLLGSEKSKFSQIVKL